MSPSTPESFAQSLAMNTSGLPAEPSPLIGIFTIEALSVFVP